jgi:LPXTG-motif cell wall-anchored protein
MVITLATDRNNPGGNLNYYITNRDYSQVYASNTISVGQRTTYSGSGPYPNSNLTIYNFGPNGISINENNYNFKLAFTFGYGKYDSIVNSNNSNYVANAWGDTTPSKATQTISYIDAETGEPMPDTTSITSSGLTGQTYQIDPRAEKIIKGYYLVNKERDHGVISQYKNGGTYTNEWVSLNGQFVKEVWHQINSSGVMQASIYINNVQQYDPNNPRGIVYPATLSNEGPTELTVSGVSGRYVFPNPYVEQTTNIKLKYATIGKIIPVDPNGNPIPGADQPQFPNDPNDPSKSNPGEKPNVPGWTPEDPNPTVNPSPKGPGENVNVTYVQEAELKTWKKDVSLTVKYVNSDGSQFTGTVPANASQSLNFSGEAYVSKVTGKLVNAKQDAKGQWIVDSSNTATPEITWTPESSSFSEVVSPVEAGYYLKNISSHEAGNNVEAISGITHTSDNVEVTVTYAPLGKMIPVDPSGKPIPDAPTPQFPNNPSDPSKGNPGNKPEVPGWTPVDPSKTVNPDPSDPGKNVPVKYVPNTPVQEEGSITVTVHDKTDNVDLPQYGKTSGEQKVGTEFTYDKNSVIQELENKGYKVLNPEVVIPTEITKGNQNIVIEVEHQLVPVTPENPGKPGEPINPNDPNGPKWPAGTDKDSLEKTGTQTIKYVAAGDKTPADNTQSFTFTRSAVVDKVTGKIVSEIGWNETSHTFGEVKTPEVSGYKADKEIAGGATITPDDLHKTIVVIYSPENPTPDTYNGSQTIKFVDPNGNELEPSNVQTATDLTGDHTFGIIDVPVINGYVSPVTTAGGATVTKDNPNAVITVVYTPVGRIIPVDPNGNPIPGQEHPQFPNNPNNPTEVIPGTKPNILGYHPENGKPGDPVNPVPGKPGEDVLVKYVPDTSTPKVPNKSTTPVKPETPAEQPAKSEKPATPSTPEKTNVSNKSEKVENTSINNIASQANKRTEKVVNKKAKTLPKTGAQNNEGVLAGVVGSALALFGLIGLIGDNKRKKKI